VRSTLARRSCDAQNVAVPPRATTIALAIALICLPHACTPQYSDAHAGEQPSPIPAEARIDINHASVEQLLKVPGMTLPWAQRIVRFRPYRGKQDLVDLGVIPGDVYKRIKDYVIAHRAKK
jgi:DNA uptake protein ComE-like DNA-binding protein